MGKKNKNKNKKVMEVTVTTWPTVSICTPTFNRRPFIPYMIKCWEQQDYPRDKLEWIIIDDGTDKIGDLVSHLPGVKYFSYETKMVLGEKRNLMHSKTTGEIIVYLDDDDYYPPTRISHAVEMLNSHPAALCAGSSIIHIYFPHLKQIYRFGPYGPNHATAGTFAFRRKMLDLGHKYDPAAAICEEKSFLKDYTVPFVQLDSFKTILVFAHEQNTFDKRRLLDNKHPKFVNETNLTVDAFMVSNLNVNLEDMKDFYMCRLQIILPLYKPGLPTMKPDVLKQMAQLEKERAAEYAQMMKNGNSNDVPNTIMFKQSDGKTKVLKPDEVVSILQQQHAHIIHLTKLLEGKDKEIELLKKQNSMNELKSTNT